MATATSSAAAALAARPFVIIDDRAPTGSDGGRLVTAYAELLESMWRAPAGTGAVRPNELKRAVGGFQEAMQAIARHDAAAEVPF
jgi:hypothetical protein